MPACAGNGSKGTKIPGAGTKIKTLPKLYRKAGVEKIQKNGKMDFF
jgi:hypothetical protein